MKGKKLKELRALMKNMHQEVLAKHLKVSQGYISKIEKGERQPSAEVIFKILKLAKKYEIEVTFEELMGE